MDDDWIFYTVGVVFLGAIIIGVAIFAAAIVVPPAIVVGTGYLIYRYNKKRRSEPPATQKLLDAALAPATRVPFPDRPTFLHAHLSRFIEASEQFPPTSVYEFFAELAGSLYEAEDLSNPLPPLQQFSSSIDEGRYRDKLLDRLAKQNDVEGTLRAINDTFGDAEGKVVHALPPFARLTEQQFYADDDKPPATAIPLVDVVDAPALVWDLATTFFKSENFDRGLFAALRHRLELNAHEMSGLEYPAPTNKIILPTAHKGTPREIVAGYLAGTPLEDIFFAQLPFSIPEESRLEHTFILGGAGAGKTTLIQQLILDDLQAPDPPALVVIDPKGLLVERLQRLAVFAPNGGPLADRLVIVDPALKPALNMFHAADRWNQMYSDEMRHKMEAQAISNFSYIFSSVESPLTQKQGVCFNFCIRLLFRYPDADIRTLMRLLDDPAKTEAQSKFHPVIQRLDDTTRNFFENDYYAPNFSETRQQIKARLYAILVHPSLMAMFSTKERKLDMFDCIQNKKIVLVNAALDAPGSEASQLFARYFVAMTLNAAFERSVLPRKERNAAYLIIDEFHLVADEVKTPEMLRLAREYRLGIAIAMQEIHGRPFNDALRAAISTNTSVKYASSPEGVDIGYVARDLRCDQDFIRAQTKTATQGRFACFVRGLLERPVSLTIPFGNIKSSMLMSDTQHEELLRRNRESLHAEVLAPPVTKSAADDAPELNPSQPGKRRW